MNIVKIVNKDRAGSKPFTGKYDSQPFIIPAGSETLVPYEAACLWLGDPTLHDIDARRKDRTKEYTRLRTKYGAYDDEDKFHAVKPKLEVYTVPGNERLLMVADDPYGEATRVPTETNQQAQVQAQVDALQAQLAMLTQQLAASKPASSPPLPSDTAVLVDPQHEDLDPISLRAAGEYVAHDERPGEIVVTAGQVEVPQGGGKPRVSDSSSESVPPKDEPRQPKVGDRAPGR